MTDYPNLQTLMRMRAKAVPATNPDAQPPRASPARPKRPPPDEAPPV